MRSIEHFLKRNKLSLKELINKLNFKSYNQIIDYCKDKELVPPSLKEFKSNLDVRESKQEAQERPASKTQKTKKVRNKNKKPSRA